MPTKPHPTRRTSNGPTASFQTQAPSTGPNAMSLPSSASVQDRIRQWQAQGAASAPAPDAISVRSIPASVQSRDESPPPPVYTPKSTPGRSKRYTGDAVEEQAKRENTRSSSTPRKRVVSDEHWRERHGTAERTTPTTRTANKIKVPHHDLSYISTEDKDDREARRERRRKDRLSMAEQRDLRTAEVYGLSSKRPNAAQDLNSYIDDELARHLHGVDRGTVIGDETAQANLPACDDLDQPPKTSKYAESLGRTEELSPGKGNKSRMRPKGARIFSKAKDKLVQPEAQQSISNRLPSIEAWLEEQPDPFVEADQQLDRLPNDTQSPLRPEPLRRRSRRPKRMSTDRVTSDPNQIWDSVTTADPLENPSPQTQHEFAPESASPEADEGRFNRRRRIREATPEKELGETSPTGLHRRGANARRQRRPQPPAHLTSPEQEAGTSSTAGRTKLRGLDGVRNSAPGGVHRLPTIASVETFEANDQPPPYETNQLRQTCDLKRKLTTHEDLMSVLSLPMHRRSTKSRRKAKTMSNDSIRKLLQDLASEEERYLRELRTLVDGVIPVLLQCVLSKSDSVAAAGLFTSRAGEEDDLEFSKPIIDMGVALERLKSLHSRVPTNSIESFLVWVQGAQRPYHDYLQSWRLGFHDVVVNLAPLEDNQEAVNQGMSRDADGDVVDSKGKKVDVAHLLKRPLVRVKNLSKMLTDIEQQMSTRAATDAAKQFSDLTAFARKRNQEEQARLEDEAAADVDVTRSRDIRTLGPTTGVNLDRTRRVRARDSFNLTFYHSTGQRLDCHIEMVFRDNPSSELPGGDVLICEIDESGKWLLFAPIELSAISARRGEDDFDLVVMVRGPLTIGQEWHELLALKADDSEAIAEWMTMLGSNPLPLKLNRARSLKAPDKANVHRGTVDCSGSSVSGGSDTLSRLTEVDIPLGEPSILGASQHGSPLLRAQKPLLERFMPRLNLGGGLQSKQKSQQWAWPVKIATRTPAASTISSDRSTISDKSLKELPLLPKASSAPTTPARESPTKRNPQRPGTSGRAGEYLMSGALPAEESLNSNLHSSKDQKREQNASCRTDPTTENSPYRDQHKAEISSLQQNQDQSQPERPGYGRKLSSTPSKELPTINKLRTSSTERDSVASTPLNESIRDQWNALSGNGHSKDNRPRPSTSTRGRIFTEDIPTPPVMSANRMSLPTALLKSKNGQSEAPPTPPPHRQISGGPAMAESSPISEPKSAAKSDKVKKRRSSSPLKHEYAPSTASEETSESDSDDMSDSSSETSNDFLSEVQDTPGPLVAVTAGTRRGSKMTSMPPSAPATTGTRTLAPSDSASQGPYRKVPASSTVPPSEKSKTIALVCSWSERGIWEQIHPDECSIVISPGLIEAFEMSAAHSGAREGLGSRVSDDSESRTSSLTQQPLVAFELTPIVPLRRGTALDINIRSPPTSNSKLRTTNNIMFRSRNADECDVLYGMINWARCNNPTYIQLQRARPRQPPVTFNTGGLNNNQSRASSWFSFGGNEKMSSYRAASAPTPGTMSIGGDSHASNGTINSAFSMLKRLGANSAFNLNRSSIRKTGLSRTSGSLYSSSSDNRTGSGSGSSTPIPSQLGFVPGKDGPNVPSTSAEAADGGGMVNNMKIRLYLRKGQSWENLGSGRLSVLPASDSTPKAGAGIHGTSSDPSTPTRIVSTSPYGQPNGRGPRLPSASHTPHRLHGNGREKRIVVRKNKNADAVLLDATLGESCFERVMQTGIAVKVWTEEDQIADKGGVVLGKERIYMLQFPGTREAGWVFGLCGSYRYRAE